jgi:hypothetical protein
VDRDFVFRGGWASDSFRRWEGGRQRETGIENRKAEEIEREREADRDGWWNASIRGPDQSEAGGRKAGSRPGTEAHKKALERAIQDYHWASGESVSLQIRYVGTGD